MPSEKRRLLATIPSLAVEADLYSRWRHLPGLRTHANGGKRARSQARKIQAESVVASIPMHHLSPGSRRITAFLTSDESSTGTQNVIDGGNTLRDG